MPSGSNVPKTHFPFLRILLFPAFIFLMANTSPGQQYLSKKASKDRIKATLNLLENHHNEGALSVWYGNYMPLPAEKLPKKWAGDRRYLDGKMDTLRRKFIWHHNQVTSLIDRFKNGENCVSVELLEMKLNERNSYGKTRGLIDSRRKFLSEAQAECKKTETELDRLLQEAESGTFSGVYELIDRPGKILHFKSYLKMEQISVFERLLELAAESRETVLGAGQEGKALVETSKEAAKSIKDLSSEISKLVRLIKTGSKVISEDAKKVVDQ